MSRLSLISSLVMLTGSACDRLTSPAETKNADIESEWAYSASSRDRITPTYCTTSGTVSIRQAGSAFEGRFTGLSSCEARGIAFADAINDQIIDGRVNGRGVYFNLARSNCPHEGGVMQGDDNQIRGSYGAPCNHSGTFVMRRK
ncbi:MAG: hypothetical protein ACT4P6_17850 [Gemmatimonadaceae bacterium]